MAGGTPAHADLAASVIRLLGNALLGRCRVSSSDLKVRIEATDLSTFPDATVVCGARVVSALDKNAVTNPSLLVEVTSNSTEDYDRGEKLNHYQQCPSLQAVLLVSHRRVQVTLVLRAATGRWEQHEFRAGQGGARYRPARAAWTRLRRGREPMVAGAPTGGCPADTLAGSHKPRESPKIFGQPQGSLT